MRHSRYMSRRIGEHSLQTDARSRSTLLYARVEGAVASLVQPMYTKAAETHESLADTGSTDCMIHNTNRQYVGVSIRPRVYVFGTRCVLVAGILSKRAPVRSDNGNKARRYRAN